MIKNRITPEIKQAFLEEIKKTRDSGKEQGFLICLDDKENKNGNNKNGRLFVSKKRYTGDECDFVIENHHDLVDTLLNQCLGEAVGTVCTVKEQLKLFNDLDLEKVECWTVKSEKVKIRDCSRATEEHKERIAKEPRKWIKPLFDREVINLNNNKKNDSHINIVRYMKDIIKGRGK